jgi:tetratricopeptide (TPR) repeat protein
VVGLGSLALIRHEFRRALAYGRRAQRLLPGSYRPYGIVGDALVELGRYDEAFAAFDRMVSLRPGLASYARVAYARELTGDRVGHVPHAPGARLAAGQPEPTAWAHVELAKLELALGRTDAARRHSQAALRVFPATRPHVSNSPAPRPQQAACRRRSAPLGSRASETPTAQAVALLGDLLERGRADEGGRRQRATVAVIQRLLAAGACRSISSRRSTVRTT